ncbi:hypothetical protein LYNGBM3L_61730 [Moorena producens 3L]|uniref:Uncharacterized protein n=1 Tax=Moorena producens 3L TaxID=489825 RepID=F4Y0N9_9CYAN|nr:hypothetical protein LYNGBM3L_61730 [Moorena producens 3L]
MSSESCQKMENGQGTIHKQPLDNVIYGIFTCSHWSSKKTVSKTVDSRSRNLI